MWLRLCLHLRVVVAIRTDEIAGIVIIIGRRIIGRCRRHSISHLASVRNRIAIIVVARLQCVLLWCSRIIIIIIVSQLWCFRIILEYIIGWIHKTGWYETLLAITAHNPEPFGIFSIQYCLQIKDEN